MLLSMRLSGPSACTAAPPSTGATWGTLDAGSGARQHSPSPSLPPAVHLNTVAVGMPVTQHPPHRSRRAALPHRALASGHNAQTRRGIGVQDVGWRQPLGCEGISPLPGDTMALTAPSECLAPIAEYPFATH